MMALTDEGDKTVIKKGYVRMKGRFFGSWKKKVLVLYGPSSQGQSRLVKYSSEKSFEDEEPSSEIPLTDIASALRCKVSDGSHGSGITLQMTDRLIKQFLCDSEAESKSWFDALNPQIGKTEILPDGMYRVLLLPCATLNYHGECIISITEDCIYLYDNEHRTNMITHCEITNIRRYGADPKKKQFLVEVGSKSPTGEGIYLFRTIHVNDIHERVKHSESLIREHSMRQRGRTANTSGPIYANEEI